MIAIIELGILVVCFYLFGVWVKSMNNYLKGYTSDILYFISQGLMIIFFLSGIAVIGIYEIYVGKPDVHEPTIWERYLPGGLMIVSSAIQLIIGIALFIRIRPGTDARLRLKYKVSKVNLTNDQFINIGFSNLLGCWHHFFFYLFLV
jgi:hypothetical protein